MYQYVEVSRPVPSFVVYKLKYENNTWSYIYRITTEKKLSDKPLSKPLSIIGNIANLNLKFVDTPNIVNLEVSTLDDLLVFFNKQRKADQVFRTHFENVDKLEPATFTVNNKTQVINKHIVKQLKKNKDTTTFVGR